MPDSRHAGMRSETEAIECNYLFIAFHAATDVVSELKVKIKENFRHMEGFVKGTAFL